MPVFLSRLIAVPLILMTSLVINALLDDPLLLSLFPMSGLGYQSSSAPQAVFALEPGAAATLEVTRPGRDVERIDVAAGARVRLD